MLKDKYHKLIKLIDKSVEEITLEEILTEAVLFFEELRREFPKASQEQRIEMIQMMNELHERLKKVSKKVAQDTGMNEDDLYALAENPSNFSPDQWQLVQETKKKLYDSVRKFSSSLDDQNKEKKQPIEDKEVKKPMRPPIKRRSRKSDWMKS